MSIFSGVNNPGLDLTGFTSGEMTALLQLAGLGDPNADSIVFWDDSANSYAYLSVGSGLSITGTTLSASSSGVTKGFVIAMATAL